jgi:signal recognition particle receptor subunit beta
MGCARPKAMRMMECATCTGADALVWMVDSQDRDRVVESLEELQMVVKSDESHKQPVLVLMNKQGLDKKVSSYCPLVTFRTATLYYRFSVSLDIFS